MKNPRLTRADRYRQLAKELSDYQKTTETALETYLSNPTPENKTALDAARDAMNKFGTEAMKEAAELRRQSREVGTTVER